MGGKSSPPPPDYGPMLALGREQMDFAKQQYSDMMPIARQVAGQQMAAQQQQMNQAQDYYDYQKNTFRPVEQGLVRDAENFNTDAYRESMASKAAASAGAAFSTQQGMSQRAMRSMGVNPNSGKGMALQAEGMLGLAAGRANAMTGARQQAEQMGWARRMDVTGLGRGLAGASTAAYQGANTAGSSGMNTSMAPGGQYQAGMAGAGQTYGGILGSQTSAYNAGMAQADPFATIIGTGIGAWAGGGFKGSDRRLKENITVIGLDNRTALPLYKFAYKSNPGKNYIGVMSDDVRARFPDMVVTTPDGYDAVNYAGLGIEMVEV